MTTIQILPDSHTDHLDSETLEAVVAEASERLAWMRDQGMTWPTVLEAVVALPEGQTLPCNLVGPQSGQPPVPEDRVIYRKREGRDWPSRILEGVDRPEVGFVTVVAGPHGDERWVLYTAYAGPAAPREMADPSLESDEDPGARWKSEAFWAEHALVD